MTQANPSVGSSNEDSPRRQYGYYTLLMGLYNGLFGMFLWFYRRKQHPLPVVTPLDLAMLGLSTLRLSKLISEDEIAIVLREPFVEEIAGNRQPAGHGLRYAVGKLVVCPTCTGTWIAAFLTYALHLSPRYTRPFLAAMTASGLSQFADAILSLVYTDRNVLRNQE